MLCSFRDRVKIVPHGTGAEFVEAVFADPTAEGIVGADWQSPFGYDIFKCKRVETFDVRVTEKLRGAIAIEYENQSAGKVALSGQSRTQVIVRQTGLGPYANGVFPQSFGIMPKPDLPPGQARKSCERQPRPKA